jgi:hypothetical protein
MKVSEAVRQLTVTETPRTSCRTLLQPQVGNTSAAQDRNMQQGLAKLDLFLSLYSMGFSVDQQAFYLHGFSVDQPLYYHQFIETEMFEKGREGSSDEWML